MTDDRIFAYRLLIADVYELAGSSRESSERLAAEAGTTAARWHVMSAVSEASHTVPVVARRLGLSRQSVQRVVNDLLDEGLVSLMPNPSHARSPLVGLTHKGDAAVAWLFERSDEARMQLLDRAGLAVDELLEARRVVRALVEAFDP